MSKHGWTVTYSNLHVEKNYGSRAGDVKHLWGYAGRGKKLELLCPLFPSSFVRGIKSKLFSFCMRRIT